MLGIDYFRLLFDYNKWANERVFGATEGVSAAEYTAPARLSFGSIRGTLAHTLGAEITWLARCQGVSPSAMLSEQAVPTLAVLRERWRQQDAEQAAFLASLGDADLDRRVTYRRTTGEELTQPFWQIFPHVVNHGMQFRAEAAVALSELGHSPGDLDLLLYLRTTGRAG